MSVYSQLGDGWVSANSIQFSYPITINGYSIKTYPQSKVQDLRDRLAPVKTEKKPKKAKPITDKEVLAIAEELEASLKSKSAELIQLSNRLTDLEMEKREREARGFWARVFNG